MRFVLKYNTWGVEVALSVRYGPHGGLIFSIRAANLNEDDDPVVASDENRTVIKFLELLNGVDIL